MRKIPSALSTKTPLKNLKGVVEGRLSWLAYQTLGLLLGVLRRKPRLTLSMLFSNFVSTILEAGTLGVVLLAVAIYTGEDVASKLEDYGRVGDAMVTLIASVSKSTLFMWMISFAIVLQIVKSLLIFAAKVTSTNLKFCAQEWIGGVALSKIMRMDYQEYMRYSPGELTEYIRELPSRFSMLIGVFNNLILFSCLLIVYLWLLIKISLSLTYVAFAVGVGIFLFVNTYSSRMKKISTKVNQATLRGARLSVEYFSAGRAIRLMSRSAEAEEVVDRLRKKRIDALRKAQNVVATIDPIIDSAMIIGVGVVLVSIVGILGEGGAQTLSGMVVFVLILYRMIPQVKTLSKAVLLVKNISPFLETLIIFLRKEETHVAHSQNYPLDKSQKTLRFREVGFRYPRSDRLVLDGVNLEIQPRTMVGVIGPSGSGKSTLLDLVGGLVGSTVGAIEIDGIDLKDVDRRSWREIVGVVEQHPRLLSTSVFENVTFFRQGFGLEQVKDACRLARVHDVVEALPCGYDTVVGHEGYSLSGGQKQRLAIARALLGKPSILLLDEATSALDAETEYLIQNVLDQLKKHMTVIIVAHRLSTIRNADNIIVINNGKIQEQGTYSALKRPGGYLQHIMEEESTKVTPVLN